VLFDKIDCGNRNGAQGEPEEASFEDVSFIVAQARAKKTLSNRVSILRTQRLFG
jgi:hypothetical protein